MLSIFLSAIFSIVATIVVFVYFYVTKSLKYWLDRGIPHVPGKFFFGHLYGIGTKTTIADRISEHYQLFKKKSDYFGMYFITRPAFIITNLDLIKNVFIRDFNNFHDRGLYVNEEGDPLSAHLFAMGGVKWRNMRNKLSPTFTSGRIKYMFSTVADKSDDLNSTMDELIEKKLPIDIKQLCVRYTADVISSAAFGIEAGALANENTEILKVAQMMFEPSPILSLKVFFLNSFQTFSRFLNLCFLPKVVNDFFMSIISQTVENREKNNIKRNDFINILIQIKNLGRIESIDSFEGKEVGKITFKELVAQSFVFFFAGYETSSTVMSFCLFELSRNQNVQEKARDEILRVLHDHGGKLTYEAVMSMIYLDQCLNEAMRKFPPVNSLIRTAAEDYQIPNTNHVIEKGMQVFIPAYAIHNDEDIFPNPEKFDPERFTPENVKSRHPFSFLPFGDGPRNCIGMRFAQVQVKVGLASLLSKFKFTLNEKTQIPYKLDPANINMAILGGLWVDAQRL